MAQVVAGSPADSAGLRAGDIVVAVAGTSLGSSTELQRRMMEDAIGRRVEITVWRTALWSTSSLYRASSRSPPAELLIHSLQGKR